MNRYVTAGLVADMHAGKRVVFVGDGHKAAHVTFQETRDEAERSAPDLIESVRATNGDQKITSKSGGFVRFFSYRSKSHRGIAADTLVVHDKDRDHIDLMEYLPMGVAEVIRL